MNVLITGAAGFIGSHLAERCLAAGDAVVGVDNFITGTPANLAVFTQDARFRFLEADVSAPSFASELRRFSFVPDLVLHFASPASPVDYAQRSLETMWVNSLGTQHCLEIARDAEARLLFASTSEIYGDPLEHPQRESYWGNVNSAGPRACYDEAKRFGEALITTWLRLTAIDARIVRIFNTYGPRMRRDDGRVVPNFVTQALDGGPLTIFGDGRQTRSFCYVSDLVEGILKLAHLPEGRGEIVNLGNSDERTIAEFAEIVCALTGVPLNVAHQGMPVDDPSRRCPDVTKARDLLGWEPRVPLEEGLRRTIDAFRQTQGVAQNGLLHDREARNGP
jgi:nucleoside-diphosphate-sugar epimerase